MTNFFQFITNIADNDDFICIMGDLNARVATSNLINLPIIDDNEINYYLNLAIKRNSKDKKLNSRGRKLLEILDENALLIVNGRTSKDIGQYTFISPLGCSTVDLGIISLPNSYINFETLNFTGSDHLPILLTVSLDTCNHTPPTTLINLTSKDLLKLKWNPAKLDLYVESFTNPEQDTKDTNNMQETLKNIIHHAAEKAGMTHYYTNQSNNNQPWFDNNCRILKELIYSYLKAFKKYSTMSYLVKYTETQRSYKNLIKTKKQQYITYLNTEILKSKNPSTFWTAINKFRPKHPNQIDATIDDLYKHYKTSFSNNKEQIVPTNLTILNLKNETLDCEITFYELETHLKQLKNLKSPGPDNIPNEFIKNSPTTYKILILKLFNKIIETNSYPTEWCMSNIYPIYKSGPSKDPKNYRPISLLCTTNKLFTSILSSRLTKFCNQQDIIPEEQAAFRANRSCLDHICCKLKLQQGYFYILF